VSRVVSVLLIETAQIIGHLNGDLRDG